MHKISLRKGILAAGLVMALSPAVLFADDVMTPAVSAPATTPQTPAEIQKAKQEQKRMAREAKKQQQQQQKQAAEPAPVKEIQDIPDPKNLGSD